MKKIKKKLKRNTHPTIIQQIFQGLHSVWYMHEAEQGPVRTRQDEKTTRCFTEQTRIGWEHMHVGRICKIWGEVNEELTQYYNYPKDATTWTATLARELILFTVTLWKVRNKYEHGTDRDQSDAEKDVRNMKIELFYAVIKPLILPQDEWLFHQEAIRKLRDSTESQVAWIDSVERVCYHLITACGCDRIFPQSQAIFL